MRSSRHQSNVKALAAPARHRRSQMLSSAVADDPELAAEISHQCRIRVEEQG